MKDGKVFGKINLIDLLVLIVAMATIVMVALKMTGHLGSVVTEKGTHITYTARVENVDPEVYENIKSFIEDAQAQGKQGDRLMANGALLNGYVTAVEATERDNQVEVFSSGTTPLIINVGRPGRVDLLFTIEADVDNNVKTELGTQEVRVGKSHIVKTTHFELVNATIMSCEWAGGTGADS